jgi:hypothetical protein
VLLRQLGGTVQGEFTTGKLRFGGEVGFASGDRNPGMGNRPGRGAATCGTNSTHPLDCDIDGLQYAAGDRVLDVRNFRFNPAYRVDLILWREILQGVTDAFYLKPTFTGRSGGARPPGAVVYSRAMYALHALRRNHRWGRARPRV